MSVGEMIGVAGLALTILGGLVHVVWLLATLKAELRALAKAVRASYAVFQDHIKTCDEDRVRLNMSVSNHETRICTLESGSIEE